MRLGQGVVVLLEVFQRVGRLAMQLLFRFMGIDEGLVVRLEGVQSC